MHRKLHQNYERTKRETNDFFYKKNNNKTHEYVFILRI